MKNRFTTVIVTTILALSVSLLAFTTPKSVMVEKKAAGANVCREKTECPKDHCPATPNCPFDNTKDDCCNDK